MKQTIYNGFLGGIIGLSVVSVPVICCIISDPPVHSWEIHPITLAKILISGGWAMGQTVGLMLNFLKNDFKN